MIGIRKPSLHFYSRQIVFYEPNSKEGLINLSDRLNNDRRKNHEDQPDYENKSLLVIGPGLIDYLVSKIDKRDDFKLTFKNCNDPIFLIPLLYKYAKKNIYSQFLLDQKIDVQITNENIRVNREIISTNYQRNFDLLLTKKIFNEQKLDINISSSNINNMLSRGINPDKKSWDQISKIAFRTFVPESEESRAKGAGGGDAND